MTRRFYLLVLAGTAAAQIVKPRIGYIVDGDGSLRAVEGVAGAFTISPALEQEVVSVAYSGKSLVVKKADQLRVDKREFDAPQGPAVVVFDAKGEAAEVFFPAAGALWTWQNGEFVSTPAVDVVTDAYIRNGELLVRGVPVRLASRALRVSQLGDRWLVVYSDDCLFAVRDNEIYELPEAQAQ